MAPTPISPSFPVNTTMNEESMTMGGYRSSSESIRSDSRHSIGSFSDNVTRTSQESARYSVYSNNSNVSASSGHPNDSSSSHMTKPLPPVLSISVEKANQWNKRLVNTYTMTI